MNTPLALCLASRRQREKERTGSPGAAGHPWSPTKRLHQISQLKPIDWLTCCVTLRLWPQRLVALLSRIWFFFGSFFTLTICWLSPTSSTTQRLQTLNDLYIFAIDTSLCVSGTPRRRHLAAYWWKHIDPFSIKTRTRRQQSAGAKMDEAVHRNECFGFSGWVL